MQKALGHFSIVPRRARALRFLAIPAALALLLSRVEPAAAVCNPSPTHPDLLQRVQDLGDCATGPGQLGATRSPQRRNPFSGGIYQDFENGQVVVYDRWASYLKPQMSHFVLSAVVEGNKVHVRWGDTSPFTYDYFLIRAELDDSQENLEASQKKEWTKKVSASNAGKVTFELDVDGRSALPWKVASLADSCSPALVPRGSRIRSASTSARSAFRCRCLPNRRQLRRSPRLVRR